MATSTVEHDQVEKRRSRGQAGWRYRRRGVIANLAL
jgi:hypothetical protein